MTSVAAVLIAMLQLSRAGFCPSEPKPVPGWFYTDDKHSIATQQRVPYHGRGLPDGVVSVITKYKKPGHRVPNPYGRGYWEFDSIAKLYLNGKLFAAVGSATALTAEKHYLGHVSAGVIYDEDGAGRLSCPVDVNANNPASFTFHVPHWVEQLAP